MPPKGTLDIIYTQRAPLCGLKRYCKMHDFTEKAAQSLTIKHFSRESNLLLWCKPYAAYLSLSLGVCRYFFPCKRWLAVDEDDGQLARELVPVDEAFMRKGDDEDEDSEATLGLEQKGNCNIAWPL